MKIIILAVLMCIFSAFGGYMYGKSQIQTKIVEKQVEVIKYVAQKRSQIQARPHASRDELLRLLREGEL